MALLSPAQAQRPFCPGFGVTTHRNVAHLEALEAKVGCRFEHVRWFQEWDENFDLSYARKIVRRGSRVEISWQPRTHRGGKVRGVPYREIARGKHDAYLRRFARSVRALGRPVNIAFAPEMNGDWGVYQITRNNTAADFKAAWRHMHELFDRERAKVRWVWIPNILYPTARVSYAEIYPGDAYVDAVGLDGYNWGTTNPWNRWHSFERVFRASYNALRKITQKPVHLGEVSSAEAGGSKPGWITNMCRTLPRFPRLTSVTWFNIQEKADWRIASSHASLQAFRNCMKQRIAEVRRSRLARVAP
ncbi:glycoside hydrolase family 26 protein [Deinobacterium chartae]|nr:glycosyl hydrolase [Deinobacterium chartae]